MAQAAPKAGMSDLNTHFQRLLNGSGPFGREGITKKRAARMDTGTAPTDFQVHVFPTKHNDELETSKIRCCALFKGSVQYDKVFDKVLYRIYLQTMRRHNG